MNDVFGEKIMKKNDINTWAATFGMTGIIKHKDLFLGLIILLCVAGYLGMQRVVVDSSNESFLPKDDR